MNHFESMLGKMQIPDDEIRVLEGDDLVEDAKYVYTHKKNIEAPTGIVWRYLMQLGCDRAGWYSIDLLDHGGKPSIDHLVEGWETRAPGDKLSATPAGDSFFNVYNVEQEKHFIMGGQGHRLGGDFKVSWAFILEPVGEDATHLIVRVRMKAAPEWSEWLQGQILAPPIHGLMQRTQLKTIKRLAERDAQLRMILPFTEKIRTGHSVRVEYETESSEAIF